MAHVKMAQRPRASSAHRSGSHDCISVKPPRAMPALVLPKPGLKPTTIVSSAVKLVGSARSSSPSVPWKQRALIRGPCSLLTLCRAWSISGPQKMSTIFLQSGMKCVSSSQ